MKQGGRYKTSGMIEDSYEPGSRGRVLQNKLGVTSKRTMDEIEAREQFRALNEFLETYEREHRFTAADLCRMHEAWLGGVYAWAGKYRQVNISKGDFTFAMARQVPALMEKFEQGPLREFTPCLFSDREEIVHALAVVHAELVSFIHSGKATAGSLECWRCSWGYRRDCRPLISGTSRGGRNRCTSRRYRPGWNTTTRRWKRYSVPFLSGRFGWGSGLFLGVRHQRPGGRRTRTLDGT